MAPRYAIDVWLKAAAALALTGAAISIGRGAALGPRVQRPREPAQLTSPPPQQGSETFGGPKSKDEPHEVHVARAAEANRGREADAPTKIPARGWKDILWRVYEEIGNDRLLAVAGGVTFYLLLAIFPSIAAVVSIYALFFDPATIGSHLELLRSLMPADAFSIIEGEVRRVVANSNDALGLGAIIGLLIALWSSSSGVKAVIDALNVIYEEEEKRSFFRLGLIGFMFTLGFIAMFLVAIAALVVLPIAMNVIGLGGPAALITSLVRWPIMVALFLAALAALYRYGPCRRHAEWKWVTVGSVFAAIAWIAGSALLSWYMANLADFNATYGSLGAVVGLMFWLWMSIIVVLVGGEINAEIEHQTARDTTEGGEKPLGARGAAMADTVGAARS